jgi:hypothetical protein
VSFLVIGSEVLVYEFHWLSAQRHFG